MGSETPPSEPKDAKESFSQISRETLKWKIKREVAVVLYTGKMFLPNILSHPIFIILQMSLPFIDYGTDYANAGMGTVVTA